MAHQFSCAVKCTMPRPRHPTDPTVFKGYPSLLTSVGGLTVRNVLLGVSRHFLHESNTGEQTGEPLTSSKWLLTSPNVERKNYFPQNRIHNTTADYHSEWDFKQKSVVSQSSRTHFSGQNERLGCHFPFA